MNVGEVTDVFENFILLLHSTISAEPRQRGARTCPFRRRSKFRLLYPRKHDRPVSSVLHPQKRSDFGIRLKSYKTTKDRLPTLEILSFERFVLGLFFHFLTLLVGWKWHLHGVASFYKNSFAYHFSIFFQPKFSFIHLSKKSYVQLKI